MLLKTADCCLEIEQFERLTIMLNLVFKDCEVQLDRQSAAEHMQACSVSGKGVCSRCEQCHLCGLKVQKAEQCP